jgi:PTS system mannose-specific IIC component
VGIGLLLKQIVESYVDILTFLVGFTLASMMGVNLIGATILGGFFGIINYKVRMAKNQNTPVVESGNSTSEEEDI